MNVRSKLFYSYLLLLIVYAGFTLLPAPSRVVLAHYHLSVTELRLLDVTVIMLLAGIWFAGFYGYAKLAAYSLLIQKGKDAKPVAYLTKGIFWLALWLPISSVISSILNYLGLRHPALIPAITIINNYVSLLFPLVAFMLISRGARGLSDLTRQRSKFGTMNILMALIVYIGLIYYHLVASTHDRATVYHLSIWPLLTTLVAPYIFMWSIGLFATYEIYQYRSKAIGIVYRQCWSLLAFGIGWLILSSIGFQYLNTITSRLNSLSIYWLLIVVYALLIVLSIGFILIAAGTRKLRRIEEV